MQKPALALSALALVAIAVAPLAACKGGSSSSSSTATDAAGIAGAYKIASATNPGGAGGYTGTVKIAKQGDTYAIDWSVASSPPFTGVGILEGNTLGVGWGTGDRYGVAVYKVNGGTLTGKWSASTSQGKVGTEKLTGAAGLSGDYKIVEATSPAPGQSYSGTVTIAPQGSTYRVTWTLPKETYSGVGILHGDLFVVGWGSGGGSAGVLAYDVAAGKLNGTWAQPGGTALGTEVLTKN